MNQQQVMDIQQAINHAAGMIVFDAEFNILEMNEKLCKYLGFTQAEILLIPDFYLTNTRFDYSVDSRTQNLKAKRTWQADIAFVNRAGEHIWFSESISMISKKQQASEHYIGLFFNIDSEKKLQQQLIKVKTDLTKLIQAKNAAENAKKANSEFFANMSHELRTPMHAILSFTHLSLKQFTDYPLSERATSKLENFLLNIENSANRLLRVLNEVLDLSKLEAGKTPLKLAEHQIYNLCQQICMEYQGRAEEKKIKLLIIQPDREIKLRCDKDKILQVLSNLLANAINYTAKNKTIQLHMEPTELILGKRSYDTVKTAGVLVSVSDQGIGIPEDELKTVFDKFIQSSHTDSGIGGSGLGLSISQQIILAHQGKIWAESNSGGGTNFKFFIPYSLVGYDADNSVSAS